MFRRMCSTIARTRPPQPRSCVAASCRSGQPALLGLPLARSPAIRGLAAFSLLPPAPALDLLVIVRCSSPRTRKTRQAPAPTVPAVLAGLAFAARATSRASSNIWRSFPRWCGGRRTHNLTALAATGRAEEPTPRAARCAWRPSAWCSPGRRYPHSQSVHCALVYGAFTLSARSSIDGSDHARVPRAARQRGPRDRARRGCGAWYSFAVQLGSVSDHSGARLGVVHKPRAGHRCYSWCRHPRRHLQQHLRPALAVLGRLSGTSAPRRFCSAIYGGVRERRRWCSSRS